MFDKRRKNYCDLSHRQKKGRKQEVRNEQQSSNLVSDILKPPEIDHFAQLDATNASADNDVNVSLSYVELSLTHLLNHKAFQVFLQKNHTAPIAISPENIIEEVKNWALQEKSISNAAVA